MKKQRQKKFILLLIIFVFTMNIETVSAKISGVQLLSVSTKKKAKSKNTELANLSIEGYELEFDKNKDQFIIYMDDNSNKPQVKAITKDDNASVFITYPDKYEYGPNDIIVKVVAENGKEKEYKINAVLLGSKEQKEKIITKEVEKEEGFFLTKFLLTLENIIILAIILIYLIKKNSETIKTKTKKLKENIVESTKELDEKIKKIFELDEIETKDKKLDKKSTKDMKRKTAIVLSETIKEEKIIDKPIAKTNKKETNKKVEKEVSKKEQKLKNNAKKTEPIIVEDDRFEKMFDTANIQTIEVSSKQDKNDKSLYEQKEVDESIFNKIFEKNEPEKNIDDVIKIKSTPKKTKTTKTLKTKKSNEIEIEETEIDNSKFEKMFDYEYQANKKGKKNIEVSSKQDKSDKSLYEQKEVDESIFESIFEKNDSSLEITDIFNTEKIKKAAAKKTSTKKTIKAEKKEDNFDLEKENLKIENMFVKKNKKAKIK